MAKRGRSVFYERLDGPLRVRIEANAKFFEYFSVQERNAIYRQAGKVATNQWRFKFLRRRIEANTVRRPPFNYKLGGKSPMVGRRKRNDPSKLINAIFKGNIKATATQKKPLTCTVAIPFGHPVGPEIRAVFKELPEDEVKWWADRVIFLALDYRAKATDATSKRKNAKPRLRLSASQRRAFGLKPRAQRSTRATR